MSAPKVFQFKLVLLGDSAVGKSSLVLRFVRGQFFEYQESTIGGAMPPTPGRRGGALVFPRGELGGLRTVCPDGARSWGEPTNLGSGQAAGGGVGGMLARAPALAEPSHRVPAPLPLRCRSDHALGVCRAQLHS